MKNLILIFIVFATCIQSNAQQNGITSFYQKYKGNDDVTSFNIGGNFLKSLTTDEDDNASFDSVLEQLNVLSLPYSMVSTSDLNALKKGITRNDYEELIRYREGKEHIAIYLKEQKDVIHELLVLVENPDDNITLVTLTGEISFDDLNKINIDGKAGDAIRDLPSERGQ